MKSSKDIKVVGVDLGGTKVAAGLVEGSEILKQKYDLIPNQTENSDNVINKIIEIIEGVFEESVQGIGIGVPSLVDKEKGIVYSVQNISSWKDVNLKEILENHFKVPVFLDNDANCFALGEHKFGVGKDDKDFVGVTIGTGVGAGIISRGHLLNDANCGSGEFGSIPYQESIYEDYCSGKFFKAKYNTNGEILLKEAKQRNPSALKAFSEYGTHMGNFIKTIMFAVDPKKIIIGGSVSKSKAFFIHSMRDSINQFPYKESIDNLEVEFTNTGNIAILGAASLYFDRIE